MAFLFGGAPKAAEGPVDRVRECRRVLRRGLRGIESDQASIAKEEARCTDAVKRAASKGDVTEVRSSALELVRIRGQAKRNSATLSRMRAMERRVGDLSSGAAISSAMLEATAAMRGVRHGTDLGAMSRIIGDFDRESTMATESQALVDEAIDDMADNDAAESELEADDVVAQVLAGFGLDMAALIADAPMRAPAQGQAWEADLEARLGRLKA